MCVCVDAYEPFGPLNKRNTSRRPDCSVTHSIHLEPFFRFISCLYWYTRAVLELCGGEMKALSSIELQKRIDLQQ